MSDIYAQAKSLQETKTAALEAVENAQTEFDELVKPLFSRQFTVFAAVHKDYLKKLNEQGQNTWGFDRMKGNYMGFHHNTGAYLSTDGCIYMGQEYSDGETADSTRLIPAFLDPDASEESLKFACTEIIEDWLANERDEKLAASRRELVRLEKQLADTRAAIEAGEPFQS